MSSGSDCLSVNPFAPALTAEVFDLRPLLGAVLTLTLAKLVLKVNLIGQELDHYHDYYMDITRYNRFFIPSVIREIDTLSNVFIL